MFTIPATIGVSVHPILDASMDGRKMYGLETEYGTSVHYKETASMIENLISITPDGLLNCPVGFTDTEIVIFASYHGAWYGGTFSDEGFILVANGDSDDGGSSE